MTCEEPPMLSFVREVLDEHATFLANCRKFDGPPWEIINAGWLVDMLECAQVPYRKDGQTP